MTPILKKQDPSRARSKHRLKNFRKLLNRWLLLDRWFPHVPLAVAVLFLGLLRIAPALEQIFGWSTFLGKIVEAESRLNLTSLRGVPDVVPGVFLILMSLGILLRSQLAWFIAILFTVASTGIDLFSHDQSGRTTMIACDATLLTALIIWRGNFRKSSIAAASIFSLASLLTLLGYALVGTYELGQQFSPAINDFFTALYFVLVTVTTVGYGDITPNTMEARLFVLSVIVLGITVFATSLSAILMPVINRRMKRLMEREDSHMERSGHYVIVGDSTLSRNTYRELKARGEVVTLVVPTIPEDANFEPEDVVKGDGSDVEVLKRAGTLEAEAVLALSNNDSENAFVVLAAKELTNRAKTVAGVNMSSNLPRVRRVRPDMVISPQVLGAEILALALRGEKIDSDLFLSKLMPKME